MERAAFYVPGVVSAMCRIIVTATRKGTRSRLGAAALGYTCAGANCFSKGIRLRTKRVRVHV